MSLIKKHKLFRIFLFIMTCLSAAVVAETKDSIEPRDVEIGAGGHLKHESPARTSLEAQYDWHAHLLWESRYVSEGRDNLSGDGIYSISTEFNYGDFTIVPWLADGVNTDYSQFDLNIVYVTKLLDNLEFFAGYTNIHTRESGRSGNDNEVSLDLAYLTENQFQILANIYYSFDAKGAFSELAIEKDYRIDNRLSINLRAILGYNFEYITDGHNGINNGQLRANLSYKLKEEIALYAYAGYNRAIDRDVDRYTGDELLQNYFWGGVGFSYRF